MRDRTPPVRGEREAHLSAHLIAADPTRTGHSLLATAKLLLDRGADANAGFLWRGIVPPFTALTGALGGGEQDEPSHPAHDGGLRLELVELLLGAGADPNDGQGLYNKARGDHDDPEYLALLLDHGLGSDCGGPWYERQRHLIPELIAQGFDINAQVGGSGTTALHSAAVDDDLDLARTLIVLGADPTIVDDG